MQFANNVKDDEIEAEDRPDAICYEVERMMRRPVENWFSLPT